MYEEKKTNRYHDFIIPLFISVLFLTLIFPVSGFSQNRDFQTFHRTWKEDKKKQQEKSVKILDAVRSSVKFRQKQLEDEAKKEDNFFYSQKVTNPDIAGNVEARRIALLKIVDTWATAGKEAILSLETKDINKVLGEAAAIGYYNGLDVIKLTRLYELGKDVIRGSYFELPDSTHPDDDYSYERIKKDAVEGAIDASIPGVLGTYFSGMFTAAEKREIEISEFMAKKQEYRVVLFKKITLAYIRALLASGDALPPCDVKSKKVKLRKVDGRDFPVVGCPDPVIEQLRRYVNAIRDLQSAETDTFMFHAKMVIAEQQLAVDAVNMIPVVGDAIDWYSLAYGLWAHEDFSGHCLSYLDYGFQFMGAVLPVVTPKMLSSWVSRNPEGAVARFLANTSEIVEAMNFVNARRVALGVGAGAAELSGMAIGKASHYNDLLANFAERWGVTRDDMQRFSKQILDWLDNVEELESDAAIKAAKTAAAKATKEAETVFMTDTFQSAVSDIQKLKKIKEEAPEFFERALKESDETMKLNLLYYQPSDPVNQAGLVPEHGAAIMDYIKKVRDGLADGMEPEDIALIYRAVNPKSAELIGKFGFHTKGMDIKGKSADWGAHDGFIPVDQNFSKLANPNKRIEGKLPQEDVDKIKAFHEKVKKFLKEKGDDSRLFQVALEIEGRPVKIVKDVNSGREITAFFDPQTRHYLDENEMPLPRGSLDTTDERPLMVLAYPDKNGKPRALTADYDLLAFGFSKDLEAPSYNPNTGFIAPKEKTVVAGTNKAIQDMTSYDGNVSHHGGEYYNPYTPGALEEDQLVLAIDLKHEFLAIKRCDQACMTQWCKTTGFCRKFGFPKVPVCDMTPVPPCIAVDVNRLLKDYMHNMRMKGVGLFPNWNWGWGDYNLLGGWTMVSFMEEKVPPTYFQQASKYAQETLEQSAGAIQKRAFSAFLGAAQPALECPDGKRASDYIEGAE
jgi:hypothetical protein